MSKLASCKTYSFVNSKIIAFELEQRNKRFQLIAMQLENCYN
ncbi:hypothetical protein A1OE_1384 [Candidatus Endolissoclinum faulkneri L2]|uniref:Uncharacterized protein n=1 Tax=Candidatus Endolissoclinum faulkneri L2 TaxID=1193729 RepID=K7Z604_9PROT|nr:hypothetical protein A1OE_1384 [Candidatus Endolissoclinum faulkneri L2]